MGDVNEKYLAILFFFKDYNPPWRNLPAIEEEQKN